MSSTKNHPETVSEPTLEEMWTEALESCINSFDASNPTSLSPSETKQAFALLIAGHLKVIRSIQHLESRIDAVISGRDDQSSGELRFYLPYTPLRH